jgi:hypothetical protein
MKCHFVYDKIVGKVLIPGCMGTAHAGIEYCTCRYNYQSGKNDKVETRKEVKELEKENASLHRIIKRLLLNKNTHKS